MATGRFTAEILESSLLPSGSQPAITAWQSSLRSTDHSLHNPSTTRCEHLRNHAVGTLKAGETVVDIGIARGCVVRVAH